jgi:hypothetical protein
VKALQTALTLIPLLAGLAGAQPRDSFVIRVQPTARRADLKVRTFITGTFGGVAGFQSTPIDDDGVLINTEYKGKPADTFKAVLYMPGCQMQLIRVDALQTAPRESEFRCEPLASIPINARIEQSILPADENAYVEVSYMGDWAHSFFKILDGMAMTLVVAEARVASDGSFTFALPDFAADPISVGIGKDAYLTVILRSRKTGNLPAFLQPDQSVRSETGDFKIEAAYPSSVSFTAHSQRW